MPAHDTDWNLIREHGGFVRRLAQSLVKDASRADDIVQEAWLAAIERPPRSFAAPRAWLGTVVRNRARQMWRSDDRRRRREAAAPPVHRVASPADELRERDEILGRVTDAVRALEERYRAVVLLRYYEGLKPSEIGARLGLSVETVRTRTRRALDQIARRLDQDFGSDHRSWALALVPFCGHGGGGATVASSGATGAASIARFAIIGVSVLAVSGALVWWLSPGAGGDDVVASAEETGGSDSALDPVDDVAAAASSPSRSSTAPPGDPPPTVAEAPPPPPEEAQPVPFHARGRVVDEQTGDAIADATVRLVTGATFRGMPSVVARTSTNAAGEFAFPRHSGRDAGVGLEVEAAGYVPWGRSRASARDELGASETIVRLSPGVEITGIVLREADDVPVEGGIGLLSSLLHASPHAGSPQGLQAARYTSNSQVPFRIDEGGRFRIATQETYVGIEVYGVDYAPAFAEPFAVETGRQHHVVIRVRDGVVLRGIARGPDGEAVVGARVNVWPAIEDLHPNNLYFNHWARPEAISGSDGRFEVRSMTPAYRSVMASHPDWPDVNFWDDDAPTPSSELLEIDFGAALRVVGRLRAGEDAAVEWPRRGELRIAHKAYAVRVDEDGAFVSDSVPVATKAALLHVDGWLDVPVDFPAGSAGTVDLGDVLLARGRRVRVQVRDDATGESLAAARVEWLAFDEESKRDSRVDDVETLEDGVALLAGLSPETELASILAVRREGYAPTRVELGGVGPDEVPIEVRLVRSATIEGTLVDAGGRPIAGGRVSVSGPKPIEWVSVLTAATGRFRIDRAVPGAPFDLVVSARSTGAGSHTIGVEPLEPGEVRRLGPVSLPAAFAFTGFVMDGTGRPVADALVGAQLIDRSGRLGRSLDPWAETDAAGRFRIGDLPPGSYYVAASFRGRSVNTPQELVDSDREIEITLGQLGSGRTWSGTVLDSSGAPVVGARIWSAAVHAMSGVDGRFTCYDLPERGKAEISHDGFLERVVEWTEGEIPAPEVRLAAGGRVDLRVRVLGSRPGPEWLGVAVRSARTGRSYSVRVEEDGTARVDAIHPGDATLEVWHDDFPLPEPLSIAVAEGDVLERTLELDAREPPIAVVVVGTDGRPIESASVQVRVEANAESGRDARYLTTLHTPRSGRVMSGLLRSAGITITVRATGRAEREIRDPRTHATREGEIRVTLEPGS